MDAATRRRVRQRAQGRCEYCLLPQAAQPFVTFHVEHIIAKKHGGSDGLENLCTACERCNSFKGPNLSGGEKVPLVGEQLFELDSSLRLELIQEMGFASTEGSLLI